MDICNDDCFFPRILHLLVVTLPLKHSGNSTDLNCLAYDGSKYILRWLCCLFIIVSQFIMTVIRT